MVTQLLFGDTCILFEKPNYNPDFVYIKNSSDNYEGWVQKDMLTLISENDFQELKNTSPFLVNSPMANVFCLSDKSIIRLSIGSRIPFYNPDNSNFCVGEKSYQIFPDMVSYIPGKDKTNIITYAKLLLNTPYLWGGKNVLGIDCSGFVQVVFSLNGYLLPRNASQQAEFGETIFSLNEAQENDLLFFGENETITHTGIYLGENKIIHSSGHVKINTVNNQGIFGENGEITHKLRLIKRFY
jgi:cell wall-associated NlpC family hydrolase